jgi:uncharacterized membrane protein YgdD (TMEM256/DUF423 family)
MRIWTLALMLIGGVLGAAGVSAAAAAAHVANTAGMNAIAQIGLAHGAALVGLAALAQRLHRPVWTLTAASLMAFGAGAFCLELALRHFYAISMFPNAAPIAGTAIIVGWLGVAVAAAREMAVRSGN